jgi:hypothetical protein
MLTRLPIGRAVVPGLRCLNAWELDDYTSFRRSSFQVFMRAVKRENRKLVPSEGRWDLFGVGAAISSLSSILSRVKTRYPFIGSPFLFVSDTMREVTSGL